MSTRAPRWALVLALMALLAAGCAGGGTSDDGAGPAGPVSGERPLQFEGAGNVRLFGTLTMPATQAGGAVPGALVILPTAAAAGLPGQAGTANSVGRDLATSIAAAGVAAYRYDQRGTGASKVEPDIRLHFDDLVADGRAGLDLLAQRRETAGRELTVVGYDEGGLVALRLAATDNRVKRLVLVSAPGRSLVDVRAAQLQSRYGRESGDALRTQVAALLSSRSLPPLDQLRTELRPLLPAQEAAFLAELYGFDPAAEAVRVRVPTMIVVPADAAPYDAQRLVGVIPGAHVVTSVGSGSTLSIELPAALTNADSAQHLHDGPLPVAETKRDTAVIDAMAQFVAAGGGTR